MCGIVGIVSPVDPIDPVEFDRFTDALAHRGPDGRGTFISSSVGLGHRRLSILDLSADGANPLPFGGADGRRYWITYNGEVFNFIELRAELEAFGWTFRTETDTEVVGAAYAQWGEDALLRFNGMWALAIWDTVERRLFLARDRFGIKPLYYAVLPGRVAFASELKAFLALAGMERRFDRDMAGLTLENPYAFEGSSDRTLMAGVRKLQGGCRLVVTADGRLDLSRWWETRDHLPQVPDRYEEQVEAFRSLFLDAVRLRLRSDVPVGLSLSGGMDSSAIAGTMAWHRRHEAAVEREAGTPPRAFIASFPNAVNDETPHADTVVRHAGFQAHHWNFDPAAALDHVLDSVWAVDEVYGGLNVPIWANYQAMRRFGVTVSVDGHGGDEVLCGYPWYFDQPLCGLNDKLYDDVHHTLLPSILRNYDRCSMAHGVEVRMPFMDWRLITFTMALPPQAKLGKGYTKRILRDAMAGFMPDTIRLRRQKIGFNSPLAEWLNSGLGELYRQVMAHPLWMEAPWWDGPAERDRIMAKCSARNWSMSDWKDALESWTRINLVLWYMLFIEGRPVTAPFCAS